MEKRTLQKTIIDNFHFEIVTSGAFNENYALELNGRQVAERETPEELQKFIKNMVEENNKK